MSDGPERGDRPAEQTGFSHPSAQRAPSGCLTAFVVLWGIAFLLVGVLITLVSGYCGFIVLEAGGVGTRDFGGLLITGFIIGIVLCIVGYAMLRGPGGNR